MDNQPPTNQTPPAKEPVIIPTNQAGPGSTSLPKKKMLSRSVLGIIAAAMIVILGAGSALGYNFWYQNEDKVVHDALMNMYKAKSIAMTGDVSVKAKGADITLKLDAKSTTTDGDISAKATVALDNNGTKMTFNADGTARIIKDTIYFKLSGIQKIVNDLAKESGGAEATLPEYASSIINKIDDKWISVKPSDYEDINEDAAKQQQCMLDAIAKLQSDKSMNNEIMKLYRDNQIIIVKEKIDSKDTDMSGSLGYKVGLDKDAAVALIKGLADTTYGKEIATCSKDFDFDQLADSVADMQSSDHQPTVELWVSRFGHQITQLAVYGKEDGTDVNMVLKPTFNANVNVEAPSDAVSLKDLMKDIQGAIEDYYGTLYGNSGSNLRYDYDFNNI